MIIKTEIGTTIIIILALIFVVSILLEGKNFSDDMNTINLSVKKNIDALEK